MSTADPAGAPEASPWVLRFVPLIRAGGRVLDLACGRGRHTLVLARSGLKVVAVDRDAAALAQCAAHEKLLADLEDGPWPLAGRRFDAVVVTNYLHRPLFPRLLDALEDEGLLIYETFAHGNGALGRPANPDFLLEPGELLKLSRGLRVLAYEDGYVEQPRPAMVQRICAVQTRALADTRRYKL